MVGGAAEDFAAAKPILDVGRQDRRPCRPERRRPDGQGGQPADRRRQHPGCSPRPLVFLEAYGVDTEAALEVLGGGLAGSKVLDQKKANMLSRDVRSPASGSTCTTRTWAS